MKYTLTFLFFLSSLCLLPAQSWKKQYKKAEKLFKQKNYEQAASLYEAAWEKKKKKTNLMYKAGECYYAMHDFRRAAQAFQKVKNAKGEAGLAGLKYARCLKQVGQYEEAKEELVYYIKRYKEDDKKVVAKIVQTEIEGCDIALQANKNNKDDILVEHLSENINSLEDDFAPIPFSGDILYFASTSGKKTNLYRSQRKAGIWSPAVVPNLPRIKTGTIYNGAFSPDHSRFYFTVCDQPKSSTGIDAYCDLYLTKKQNGEWSTPQKLHDYIKDDGSTITQPFVIHRGDEEILFFVSDKSGGFGGLDIWYTKRQIKSDDIDFGLPKNAGPMVNTLGDEISPYYNTLTETLYFSSNGHPSIGGFDLFQSKDKKGFFGVSKNLGLPLNSPNDDLFYIEESGGEGGFFCSNRLFGLEKITTTHYDIFYFSTPREQLIISGTVKSQDSHKPLETIVASLFEIKSHHRKRLLQAKTFPKGRYEFVLLPNKEYSIVVEQNGYGAAQYNFSTFYHDTTSIYHKDFVLAPGRKVTENAIASNLSTPIASTTHSSSKFNTTTHNPTTHNSAPSHNNNSWTSKRVRTKHTTKTKTKKKTYPRRKAISDAPKHDGVYYKVQLRVVNHFNPNQSIFREVKNMGRLDTEFLPKKKWYRVLLADFFTIEEAHIAMMNAKKLGFFDAFLVKYRDGKRVTP